MPDLAHERRVADFLKKAESGDPDQFRAVCDAYPVLSPYALRRRRSREVTLASLDRDLGAGGE